MSKDPTQADRIKKYRFTTDKQEPCTAQVSIRIPPSLKSQLKESKGWQDYARKALQEYVDLESA